MKVDYIIVGHGLAGTLLAYELMRLGKKLIVFDDPLLPKSSDVAAGLINPIVFKRMTKSWLVDTTFPQMESTYRNLEELLNQKFYFRRNIHRILGEEECLVWEEKAFADELQSYLYPEIQKSFNNKFVNKYYRNGIIFRSGRVDLQTLIAAHSTFMECNKAIRKEKLSIDKLKIEPDFVRYQDIIAEKIIFCEGSGVSTNPFFENLRFKHSKGETLEIQIPDLKLTEIVSQDIFIIPIGEDHYKIGATYTWDQLDFFPTESAKDELISKFRNIISEKIRIKKHQAGIRPTMHDRKPVLGFLPDSPRVGIFNGLGSKGVLLAPYFAKQFALHINNPIEAILGEVNINRYFRK